MITLPPKLDGTAEHIDDSSRPIVIVGANGAGKTRFTNRLCADLGERAFRINALDGLYNGSAPDPAHNAIDRLYASAPVPAYEKQRQQTRLERLTGMLLADELVNLLRYKFGRGDDQDACAPVPATRLDTMIKFWQKIFPGNRVLVDGGNLRFGRDDSSDLIAATRLSDGERVVLYYGLALLYAPAESVVMVESPELFLHPSTMQGLWNSLELLRPDCRLIYTTHDLEFAASRRDAEFIWVRACDTARQLWDYQIIPDSSALTDQVSLSIMGARKPVLFIEGDARSIDARLYPLIFSDCTVKSLGSCNKVIEATRIFNDLNAFHHLSARGIVDRDRRDEGEISYLRRKSVMVPEVAEIENMLLLPAVISAVALSRGRDPKRVVDSVRKSVTAMFKADVRAQALQHTRHSVKRTVEYRIDGRFNDIDALEHHIEGLVDEIKPRQLYEKFCRTFHQYIQNHDYEAILRVYNQKSMLPGCNVAGLCGLASKEAYIAAVMDLLRAEGKHARSIRTAVRAALRADGEPEQ